MEYSGDSSSDSSETCLPEKSFRFYFCCLCKFTSYEATDFFLHVFKTRHEQYHLKKNEILCPFCAEISTTMDSFMDHLFLGHAERVLMKCQRCSHLSYFPDEIIGHYLSQHGGNTPLVCQKCSFCASHEIIYYKHLINHCGESGSDTAQDFYEKTGVCLRKQVVYCCSLCCYIMVDDISQDSLLLECPECSAEIKVKKGQEILDYLKSKNYYPCVLCSYMSSDALDRMNHIRLRHPNEKQISCSLCNYKSYFPSDILKHKNSHNSVNFYCSDCSYKTADYTELVKHRKEQHLVPLQPSLGIDDTVSYAECYSISPDSKEISKTPKQSGRRSQKHRNKKTETVLLEVHDTLDENFDNTNFASQKHEQDGEHKCYVCGFTTNLHPERLRRHLWIEHQLRTHPNNRKKHVQVCPICPFQSFSYELVVNHIKEHHKNFKPSKCLSCGFETYFPEIMKHHQLVHKAKRFPREGIYACPVCDYKNDVHFEFLKRHISEKHSDLPHIVNKLDRDDPVLSDHDN